MLHILAKLPASAAIERQMVKAKSLIINMFYCRTLLRQLRDHPSLLDLFEQFSGASRSQKYQGTSRLSPGGRPEEHLI
jgi:hypothetical protein